MNFRQGFLAGTLGAALAAGVAASRASAGFAAFLVLLGGAALVFGATLAGLAAARPVSFAARAALVGLGLSALPLAMLASVLKATTHHRPLGAVTFAVLALVLCLGSIAVSARVLALTDSARSSAVRSARVVLMVAALAGPVVLLGRAAASANLREGVFDVALGLGTGAVLALLRWPPALARVVQLSAVPVWLGTVVIGILVGLSFGGGASEQASPALAAPISWILR